MVEEKGSAAYEMVLSAGERPNASDDEPMVLPLR